MRSLALLIVQQTTYDEPHFAHTLYTPKIVPLILPSLSWPHGLRLCWKHLKRILPLMLVVTPPNLNKHSKFSPVLLCQIDRKSHVPFIKLLSIKRLRTWLLISIPSLPAIVLSYMISQRSTTRIRSTSKSSPRSQDITSKKELLQFRI